MVSSAGVNHPLPPTLPPFPTIIVGSRALPESHTGRNSHKQYNHSVAAKSAVHLTPGPNNRMMEKELCRRWCEAKDSESEVGFLFGDSDEILNTATSTSPEDQLRKEAVVRQRTLHELILDLIICNIAVTKAPLPHTMLANIADQAVWVVVLHVPRLLFHGPHGSVSCRFRHSLSFALCRRCVGLDVGSQLLKDRLALVWKAFDNENIVDEQGERVPFERIQRNGLQERLVGYWPVPTWQPRTRAH